MLGRSPNHTVGTGMIPFGLRRGANLMTEAGLIVLCSFISPERDMVGGFVKDGEFIGRSSTHGSRNVSAAILKPLRQGQGGRINNFTGFDAPYESPPALESICTRLAGHPNSLPTWS
jgi:bifunctional enzyme CysN/CysC